MVGRRRADFDQHKDLIIKLYHEKTPWSKIESILLNEHGCRAKSRTIMRRFKEWDLDFHRVQTKKSDNLNDQIRSYWEDRSSRPKTDEELLQKLLADGFTVSLSAIIQIRKELKLYRRWDERLGRYRPDSELGKRGRRRQKHSVFTEAKLAPPPDASDPEDAGYPAQRAGQHDVAQQPWSPGVQSMQSDGEGPRRPEQSIQLSPQVDLAASRSADPGITSRDARIKALLDRVTILEQHCLANGIGLPYAGTSADVPIPGTSASPADRGPWQIGASFLP
ncbi:hypothetical protein INS49_015274 [Diaporthe citri]|uniref:uncharacterized protein n=1 Tax=Diaporthe citri TaxID=83186 RepID=UPI001C81C311|nr:uncharacterized protein INS49_015274 [Diaporthe citri]KAG6355890.1 hypothetical protein INS49_015274 [Diaporthe citri]